MDYEDGSCAVTGWRGEAEDIVIPEQIDGHAVTEIYDWAFSRCEGIKTLTVPGSVRRIGKRSFEDCDALTAVTLPEGVETLEDAFCSCDALEILNLPASLTVLTSNPTRGCFKLTEINVAEGNANYRSVEGVVYDAALTRSIACPAGKEGPVSIPSGVRTVGGSTFENCLGITSVDIPVTVTTIEAKAFHNCTSLESLSLPVGVESIEGNPFDSCWELGHIEVSADNPHFVVADGVLYSSDMTRLICAPAGIAGRFDIPESVVTVEHDALTAADYSEVRVPAGTTQIRGGALDGDPLERIIVSEDNPVYCAVDGILYDKGVTGILRAPKAIRGRIVVPEGISRLEENVFHGCDSITGVILPEGLASIGVGAFSYCEALSSIRIPDTVKEIETAAFHECNALQTVALPEGMVELSGDIFDGCTALRHVDLPSALKTIREDVFYGCESLRDVTIPEGVTAIDYNAFRGCEDLTLHVTAGSYGERFAMETGIPYTHDPEPEYVPGADAQTEEGTDEEADEAPAPEYAPLQKGSKGEDVKALQLRLIELGFLNGKADGDYGRMTAAAVSAFQKSAGLPETGAADEVTQKALFGE